MGEHQTGLDPAITSALGRILNSELERMGEHIGELTKTSIENRVGPVEETIANTKQALSETIDAAKAELETQISALGVPEALETERARLTEQIDTNTKQLSDAVDERLASLDGANVLKTAAGELLRADLQTLAAVADDIMLRKSKVINGEPRAVISKAIE